MANLSKRGCNEICAAQDVAPIHMLGGITPLQLACVSKATKIFLQGKSSIWSDKMLALTFPFADGVPRVG